jgi:predicted GIY-YIG superfamily endonuclease
MFWYVYLLESEGLRSVKRHYVGRTRDLSTRIAKHNAGQVPHTAKFRPWHLRTAIAFDNESRAIAFELYLKSSSGRAFSKKRF